MSTNINVNQAQRSLRSNNGGKSQPGWGQGQSRSAKRRRNARRNNAQTQAGQAQNPNGGTSVYIPNSLITAVKRRGNQRPNTGSYQKNRSSRGYNSSMVYGDMYEGGLPQYVGAVLDPSMAQACRVPTLFAYPTAVMKMTWQGEVTPNASGNVLLTVSAGAGSGSYIMKTYNGADYSATSANGAWSGGFSSSLITTDRLPANRASKHRTVGCSLKVWYSGRDDAASGKIVGAFVPRGDENLVPSNMQEEFYSRTMKNNEICEVIWIPREDIDMDFIDYTANSNTSWLEVACIGFPASVANSISYEINMLKEYVPTATNYEAAVSTVDSDRRAVEVVQSIVNRNPNYVVSPASDDPLAQKLSVAMKEALSADAGMSSQTLAKIGSSEVSSWIDYFNDGLRTLTKDMAKGALGRTVRSPKFLAAL